MCSKTVVNYSHFNDKTRGGSAGNCPLFDNVEERHEQEVQKAAEAAKEKLRRENPSLDEKDLEIQWSEEVKKRESQRMQAAQLLVRPHFGHHGHFAHPPPPPPPPAPPAPQQRQPPPPPPPEGLARHRLHWGPPDDFLRQPVELRNYGPYAPPPAPAPAPMVWPLYQNAHIPVMDLGVDMPLFDPRNQAIQVIPEEMLDRMLGIREHHQALFQAGPLGPLYHAPLVPQRPVAPGPHNGGGPLFPRPAAAAYGILPQRAYVAGNLPPHPAAPASPAAPAAPAPAPAAHTPGTNPFRRQF